MASSSFRDSRASTAVSRTPTAGKESPMKREHFLINGKWRAPSGADVLPTISAATEQQIGQSPVATTADIDVAVQAARDALPAWRDLSPVERAGLMERLSENLQKRTAEIGPIVAQEVGTPLAFAGAANVLGPVSQLRYYASKARDLVIDEERPAFAGRTVVHKEPVGVVGVIVPWNYPIGLIHFKLAPALAAGCTVVVKPSPETALSSYLFADAVYESGFPPGVINVVPGDRVVGEHLVRHDGVDKIAFTGSTAAGRRIGELCGAALKPVTLELGGKSAAVLLEDAPLEAFIASMGVVCMANNGQTCVNNTRILAPASRYDDVVDAVTNAMSGYRVGDPLEAATEVGPVVNSVARDRIEGYIAEGLRAGARITTGGGRPAGREKGWFVSPTVFADVDPGMSIAREEIFGPVLTVLPYEGGDEGAAHAANDSIYGLGGTVWSADVERGRAVARRIDTGTVGVNTYTLDVNSPFGGHKASGLGYELGDEGLAAYFKLTSIYLPD
nr:aldehyde dehydrogenase [Nocardia sp. 852002-20019_SCH5090214]